MRWATLTQTRGAADKEVDPKGVDRVKGNHGEGAVQGAGPRGQVTIPGQDLVGGGGAWVKGECNAESITGKTSLLHLLNKYEH